MQKKLRQYLFFILAGITYIILHEGIHAIQAIILGIYKDIKLHPLGLEIVLKQPLTINGMTLARFSGLSSILTIVIGYLIYFLTPRIIKLRKQFLRNYLYFVGFVFLLLDPLYISILSFFVGGDINGIAQGLNTSYTLVRLFYFVIFCLNLYLVIKKYYPQYVPSPNKE